MALIPLLSVLYMFAACAVTCQNGGTLNTGTCTCDCAEGYSGASCGINKTACELSKTTQYFFCKLPVIRDCNLHLL